MSVPAATVKSLCTSAEVELVRASRKPQLETLVAKELKSFADRARKLHDKWRDAKRDQARSKSRVAGVGKPGDNTKVKAQIFREALESFEARLKKLVAPEGRSKGAAKSAVKSAPASKVTKTKKTKAERAVDHRNRRSGVREGLAVTKDILNEPARKAKAATKVATTKLAAGKKPAVAKQPAAKPVAPPAAAAPSTSTAAESQVPAPVAKPSRAKKTKVTKLHAPQAERINAAQQLEAVTAAKHARVVRSGRTTRMLGHTQARGQRKQARRDARN